MVGPRPSRESVTSLTLSRRVQWTLHHVLADQLGHGERGCATADTAPAVWAAFETLDAGGTQYTTAELEAVRRVVARAHHSRRWESDRPQLEQLLHRLSVALDAGDACTSDREDGL